MKRALCLILFIVFIFMAAGCAAKDFKNYSADDFVSAFNKYAENDDQKIDKITPEKIIYEKNTPKIGSYQYKSGPIVSVFVDDQTDKITSASVSIRFLEYPDGGADFGLCFAKLIKMTVGGNKEKFNKIYENMGFKDDKTDYDIGSKFSYELDGMIYKFSMTDKVLSFMVDIAD